MYVCVRMCTVAGAVCAGKGLSREEREEGKGEGGGEKVGVG